MQAFVIKLWEMGDERMELVDTTDGRFIKRRKARRMELSGPALLPGR